MSGWSFLALGFVFVVGSDVADDERFGLHLFLGHMGCQQFRQTCISFNPTRGLAILRMHFVSNIFCL
jgi:hypothetical protein